MSWIRRDCKLSASQKDQFTYDPSESLLFTVSKGLPSTFTTNNKSDHMSCQDALVCPMRSSTEWETQLKENDLRDVLDGGSKINLVLAGKSDDAELSGLPFTEGTFGNIAEKMATHSSIARAINRNKSCHFGRIPYEWTGPVWHGKSFVYNCRTTDTWANDMALSITYFPGTLITNAIWYGCDLNKKNVYKRTLSDADIITGRLKNFDGEIFHPMMLPTLFAERERERLVNLSRAHVKELVRRLESLVDPRTAMARFEADSLASLGSQGKVSSSLMSRVHTLLSLSSDYSPKVDTFQQETIASPSPDRGKNYNIKNESTVLVWLSLSDLRNGLESWRAQVVKMVEHMEELNTLGYGLEDQTSSTSKLRLSALRSSGERIMGRLQELLVEFDEAARDCTRAMEGMSLANQLETNIIGRRDTIMNQRTSENSLHLARLAHRDAEIMKPVAVLGMIFLPGMFTSSFFSIGFFEYKEDKHLTMPQFVGIWASVTVVFTVLTIVIFQFHTARQLRKVEAQSKTLSV